jgi:hypothetical protein
MKYAILLILTIALAPNAIAQQQYKEKIYVFSLDFSSAVSADEECTRAVAKLENRTQISGIIPTFGTRFKINSVETSSTQGKVTDMAVEEIGEMLTCHDEEANPPEMNLVPIYNEITIGDRTFLVEGAGRHPLFPNILPGGRVQMTPPGYPTSERLIFNINGTVLSAIPGRRGGAYMESALVGNSGEFGDGLSSNSIVVFRVLLPVNP